MFRYCQIACGLMLLSAAIVAQADTPFDTKQFSATVVMDSMPAMPATASAGHSVQGSMKMYRSGDKMRTDLPGGSGYMIMDLAQHANYMVMSNGMCMQMSSSPHQNPFAQAHNAAVERSPAGTETVDGHLCKVENVTVTPSGGQRSKMKVWEAEDLKGFPIKIEVQSSHGPMVMQYKDVNLNDPDASLFVHPENCRLMPTMPGQMPGQMPGGQPPGSPH